MGSICNLIFGLGEEEPAEQFVTVLLITANQQIVCPSPLFSMTTQGVSMVRPLTVGAVVLFCFVLFLHPTV